MRSRIRVDASKFENRVICRPNRFEAVLGLFLNVKKKALPYLFFKKDFGHW